MNEENEEFEPVWYPYEAGVTAGKRGPEGGVVLSDEELGDPEDPEDADARLTLERSDKGFSLVGNLYGGWLYVVAEVADETDARRNLEELRGDLETLSAAIPMEDSRDVKGKVDALLAACAEVESRYSAS
jgi:hypothetical protein